MVTKKLLNLLFTFTLTIGLISCTPASPNHQGMSTLGATALGAGIGAGAGALVGASISNGDVWASAGLGAGIGAGTVLVSRYAYKKYKESREINGNNYKMSDNYYILKNNALDLEEYRRYVLYESQGILPTEEVNRHFEGVVN